MAPVNSANSVVLLVVQRPALRGAATEDRQALVDRLTAAANGQPADQVTGADGRTISSKSKLADSLFSVNNPSLTQIKLDLFERVGEALGVEQSNFESMSDYGAAIKSAVTKMKAEPGGMAALIGIEKELGLDKLGVSLDAVTDAMTGDADANEKLDKALTDERGQDLSDPARLIEQDELGLYAPAL